MIRNSIDIELLQRLTVQSCKTESQELRSCNINHFSCRKRNWGSLTEEQATVKPRGRIRGVQCPVVTTTGLPGKMGHQVNWTDTAFLTCIWRRKCALWCCLVCQTSSVNVLFCQNSHFLGGTAMCDFVSLHASQLFLTFFPSLKVVASPVVFSYDFYYSLTSHNCILCFSMVFTWTSWWDIGWPRHPR